ncbi:hypothetical protein ACFQL1_05050 [Halomicroarcula sp. GCM10025709]|uniref:hypothetical protein n=1 Tax=Halomicroarcula sp. GCM10025709 TaxID=3252669 RepID=UPI0036202E65
MRTALAGCSIPGSHSSVATAGGSAPTAKSIATPPTRSTDWIDQGSSASSGSPASVASTRSPVRRSSTADCASP